MKARRARRYSIRELADNRCTLTNHATGVECEYWMPTGGGYVREIDDEHPGTLGRQVCDGLSGSGSTLTCYGRLVNVIRREARAAYRRDDALNGRR